MDKRWIIIIFMILAAQWQPARAGGVCMLQPSIPVDNATIETVRARITADETAHGVCFAITSAQTIEQNRVYSVAGFLDGREGGADWLIYEAVWYGTVYVVDGTFAGLEDNTGGDLLNSLPQPENFPTVAELPILPFAADTSALYGPLGVHAHGDSMLAVDFVGGPSSGASMPNMIYAAVSGQVTHICQDNKQWGIRIDGDFDFYYLHFDIATSAPPPQGAYIAQGQALGKLVTGTMSTNCGYTSQGDENYHLHFAFYESQSPTLDGWNIDTVNETFYRDSDTIYPTDYITAEWLAFAPGDDPPDLPPGDPSEMPDMQTANFWSQALEAIGWIAEQTKTKLPVHEFKNIAGSTSAQIEPMMQLFVILVPYNMTVPLLIFGIIAALEIVRITYAGWMWVKRAIPLIG